MTSSLSIEAKTRLLQQIDTWPHIYPSIPASVALHARGIVRDGVSCSLLRSLVEEPAKTPAALNSFFQSAGAILGLTGEPLVRTADWHPKDLDLNRFDAMIAELRTVVWLSEEGFCDIRLLRSEGQKRADGTAHKAHTKYAVEVACVTGWRPPSHDRRSQDLKQVLLDKYDEKKSQLDTTAARQGCQSRVLVCVFVGLDQTAMITRQEYLEQGLKPAWYELGAPTDTHLAVIAHPSDNCVFPPW